MYLQYQIQRLNLTLVEIQGFASLGWVLSAIATIIWCLVNLQSGYYMSEVFLLHPYALSYSDLAYHSFGEKFRDIITFVTYTFMILILGDYLLLLAQTLGMLFYTSNICGVYWSLISCVEVLPFLQLRLLNSLKLLVWLNVLFITVALFITLGAFTSEGTQESLSLRNASTQVVNPDLNFLTFFQSMSLFAFAYTGSTFVK